MVTANGTARRPAILRADYLETTTGGGTPVSIASGAAVAFAGSQFTVSKPADEPRTSNTTVSQDADLVVSLLPLATYRFRFVLFYNGAASATADVKCSLIAGGVPSLIVWGGTGLDTGAALTTPVGQVNTSVQTAAGTLRSFATAGPAVPCMAVIEGTITGGSGGTLALQWAQRVSNATSTIIMKGSSLTVERIG